MRRERAFERKQTYEQEQNYAQKQFFVQLGLRQDLLRALVRSQRALGRILESVALVAEATPALTRRFAERLDQLEGLSQQLEAHGIAASRLEGVNCVDDAVKVSALSRRKGKPGRIWLAGSWLAVRQEEFSQGEWEYAKKRRSSIIGSTVRQARQSAQRCRHAQARQGRCSRA